MRKLFLLIPAILLTLAISAKETPVAPGSNAIQAAVAAADPNDVLVLSTGTYNEEGNFSINKNITIQAADGEHPVIAQRYYIKIEGGAAVTFKGIKFDGGAYGETGAYNHCLRAYDSSNGDETVTLEDCELTRYPSYIIYTYNDTRRWDAITIRNCYFYNNASYAIVINAGSTHQSCNSLTIQNSTFAGFTGSNDVIFYDAPDAEHTTSLNMDHCTFYNHPRCAISWQKSTNLNVTNCIFAQPSSVSYKSIECVGGTITNCLSYNSQGYSSAATPSGNLTVNPYFVNTNPDNYDFTVASFSLAHNAGTDSKTLGDYLRWTSDDSAHPTTINISVGTDAIKAAVEAAWPGDEIILAAGTYEESERVPLDKRITIKAAEGASVIVKPHKDNQITNGAKVKFIGIKFDGSEMGTYEYFIRSYDATAGKELRFEKCEMTGFAAQYLINAASAERTLDSVIINDCKCVNNGNDAIYIGAGSSTQETAKGIIVKNSTFANFADLSQSVIEVNNYGATKTPNIEVTVDHCTFYNNPTSSSGYADVRVSKSTKVAISNCIFAHPEAYARCGTYCYGGTINNCLSDNLTSGTKGHRSDDIDVSTCLPNANPLFTDAASGNFTLKRNYITGEVSPAYGAGTDGSTLGDPRWETTATYPETDFSGAGYVFTAAKAKLNGDILYETGAPAPQDSYLRYYHANKPGTAEWVIKATRACYVQVIVNTVDNTWNYQEGDAERQWFVNHKHIYVVEVRDANETLIGSVKECDYNEDGSTDGVETNPNVKPDLLLPGYIYIPEAGVYTIKLRNPRNYSRCGVGSVTISYMGGDTQTITNTADFVTDIDDAYFSANGTRADGKISFSGNAVASEWVRWNVTVANSDYYDITLNSAVESGHIYSVTFYDGETQVASVAESGWHNTTGAIGLGRRFLPAGDYVLEIKNSVSSNSDAQIVSVGAIAFVAPVTALPNALPAASAITSELAYVDGGELYFTPSDKRGHILDQWAKWKVSVAEAGSYLFTMNVTSINEQSYKITILDSENNELDSYAKNPGSGAQPIKHYFNLAAGSYYVMVQNTTNHSDGHMVSMVVSQPEMVTLDEEATDNTSWAGKVGDNNTYDVQINRTIVAGMYNTLCLPFAVSSSQCREIFGSDVQLRTFNDATIEDGGFVLNLNFNVASDIYQGTPVLIKTSQDIVNPIFVGVQFATATPATSPGTNANFVGNFVKGTIDADPNNLFLGANNTLFFPTVEMPISGMRAYFIVHDVPMNALQRARIVEDEQVATEIDLVSQEPRAKSQKLIINGQLIIIRDGVRYNVMGAKIQ